MQFNTVCAQWRLLKAYLIRLYAIIFDPHRLAAICRNGNWSKWDEAETYEKKALDIVVIKYHDKDAIETILLNMCYMKNGRSNWGTVLDQIKSADPYARPWNLDDSTFSMPFIYIERTYLNGKDVEDPHPFTQMMLIKKFYHGLRR